MDRRLAYRGLVIGYLPAERSAFGGQFLQARFFVEMRAVLVLEIDPRDVVLLTRVADDRKAAARRCDACALKRDLAVERLDAEGALRSEEHTAELQSLQRISYAEFGLTKQTRNQT